MEERLEPFDRAEALCTVCGWRDQNMFRNMFEALALAVIFI